MSIREGKCPECGSTEVRCKSIRNEDVVVQWFAGAVDFATYVCLDCGAVRTYIEEPSALKAISKKWDKVQIESR